MNHIINPETILTALVANTEGEIFELENYGALGMSGSTFTPLTEEDTQKVPEGGELMFMPDRKPTLYNKKTGKIETLDRNPNNPGEKIFPVSTFNSPGFVITQTPAYEEREKAGQLPLFSYGAVGWHKDGFRSAVLQVDKEPRQDLKLMPEDEVSSGVLTMRIKYPENRLIRHIENCGLNYGCPAAKNFFIGRYEAPLPTAQTCNARCLGCISLQKGSTISCCQERIKFTPTSKEIAELSLEHIGRVEKAVVSFGQGCEGDPLMAAEAIEPAIRMIREKSSSGTINMNTNAGHTKAMISCLDAGLDSIRVSMNSIRKDCYEAYFRPVNYSFEDVVKSMDEASRRGVFISINYLNIPGFTDSPEEFEALVSFMKEHTINFIQWRNLNYDPLRYHGVMNKKAAHSKPMGIPRMIAELKKIYPELGHGYFNPPKESFPMSKS